MRFLNLRNKKINSQIKKPHLKMIPIKDKYLMLVYENNDRQQICVYMRERERERERAYVCFQ